MRVICEYQAYIEPHVTNIAARDILRRRPISAAMRSPPRCTRSRAKRAPSKARLSKSDWIVGDAYSAVDMVIFPGIQLLKRALEKPQARALSSRFMPVEVNYPALGRWLARVAALPGYERTYPPHWRDELTRAGATPCVAEN